MDLDCESFPPAKRPTRIVIQLNGDVTPYSAENFRRLCVGGLAPPATPGAAGDADAGGFKGSHFHDLCPDMHVKGGRRGTALMPPNEDGGRELPLAGDGAGTNASAFAGGQLFASENFDEAHGEGTVSSVASGKRGDQHGSEWFVCLSGDSDFTTSRHNGTHVVIGRVVRGLSAVKELSESMRSTAWGLRIVDQGLRGYSNTGRPAYPVWVADCGELEGHTATRRKSCFPDNLEDKERKSSGS